MMSLNWYEQQFENLELHRKFYDGESHWHQHPTPRHPLDLKDTTVLKEIVRKRVDSVCGPNQIICAGNIQVISKNGKSLELEFHLSKYRTRSHRPHFPLSIHRVFLICCRQKAMLMESVVVVAIICFGLSRTSTSTT